MFIVDNLGLAIVFCIVTMLGWGSWANTQKLAGKDKWPFQLYYWDYAIGVLFLSVIFMFTLGSVGNSGMGAVNNLAQAGSSAVLQAVLSGVIFNISNILLVVAIDAAGMSVAFPVGVGLSLVIGTVASYVQSLKGSQALLFSGVALVVVVMILSAISHSKLPRAPGRGWARGVVFAVIAGCLMGFFYPQLMRSISPGFNSAPIQAGLLAPYTGFFFSVGLLLSNFIVNTVFMKTAHLSYSEYFRGAARLHLLGFLGGIIWALALGFNVIASGAAGPAISYALGQGTPLVAAIWSR